MPELVGDIKKIDQDKIREGREILLKYLAETDQQSINKTKPPEIKPLEKIGLKPVEEKVFPAAVEQVKPVEAKIDFVKDFKTAEAKLHKPIVEIFHPPADKPEQPKAVEALPAKPQIEPANISGPEMKLRQALAARKLEREKLSPPVYPEVKKIIAPAVPKIKLKKRDKIKHAQTGDWRKRGAEATSFLNRVVFKFFSGLTMVVTFYLLFGLSLYTFHFDNRLTRLITKIFPVPAFITKYGAINYYDFSDEKITAINKQNVSDRALGEALASVAVREQLIRRQILADLAKNYGLSLGSFDSSGAEQALEKKLALLIVSDPSVNAANLRKARVIKTALAAGADFKQTAESSGLQSKIEYFNADAIKEKFDRNATELMVGNTIETVTVKEGYYLLQFYNQQDSLVGLKFIFIPATTLEMIMADRFKEANLIILAN